MEGKCSDNDRQPQCCASGDCSSPAGPAGARSGRWKTIVFAAVMLAAVAVAAHSLMTGDAGRAWEPGEPAAAPPEAAAPEEAAGGQEAALEKIDDALAEHDFAFVIVPARDGASPEDVTAAVSGARAKIRAKGVTVAAFTLKSDGTAWSDAVSRFGIDSFPAVVAMKKGCSNVAVMGAVNETSLLGAYREACMNAAACGPGACGTGAAAGAEPATGGQ